MKYIDSEKLIAEIEERIQRCEDCERDGYPDTTSSEATLKSLRSFITSIQQEQPEVDLEKFTEKVKTFQGRYKHPEIVSIKGAMAFMARMFYQYPNTARLWYDRLPKSTMD